MLCAHFSGYANWLVSSSVVDDPIWSRSSISELDIQLFYRRATARGLKHQAIEAIDRAQGAAILALIENPALSASLSALVTHVPPDEALLLDEFLSGLRRLPEARRQACLWALESGCDPDVAMQLKWTQVRAMQQKTPLAAEVIESARVHRHIRLPYVFWEWATERIATPLLELGPSIEGAFNCAWPRLSRRYADMVMIDRRADAEDFKRNLFQVI